MTQLKAYRGPNAWPTDVNIAHANRVFPGLGIFRWGPELDEYWADPSEAVDVANMLSDLRPVIDNGMKAIIVCLDVPAWINANVDGSDGGHHRLVVSTDPIGRLYRMSAISQICDWIVDNFTEEERTRIRLEENNEVNIVAFNRDLQPAADAAAGLRDFVAMVRDHSDLKCMAPGFAPYGNLNNGPETEEHQWHMDQFWRDMVAAEPELATTLQPDFLAAHTYHWGGGADSDYGTNPLDTLGWNGTQHALALHAAAIDLGMTNTKVCITEYGGPSAGNASYNESWHSEHLIQHEAALFWYAAAGIYDTWATFHTLRDYENYGDSSDVHDYFGVLHRDGSAKTCTNQLKTRWEVELDPTTIPEEPPPPVQVPVIDGEPIEVSPNTWGYRLGFTVENPAPSGTCRAVRSLGCKQLRILVDELVDYESLGRLVAEAKTEGVHTTVALRPAGGDYASWTTARLLFFIGSVKQIAAMGVRCIELGPGINDPSQASDDEYAAFGGELWTLSALIFAKNALASDYPHVELYAGALATVGTGTPPHEAIDALCRDYNPELSQCLSGFSIDGDDAASGALFDATGLPYANPIFHVPTVLASMQSNGVLRPISFTKIGYTGNEVELAFTWLTYLGKIDELVNQGLRLGRVFWNTLFDADTETLTAPFTAAGEAKGSIVNAIVARATQTFPG